VLGVNPQVYQAKLDNARLWSSFGCPGGHDLDNKAIHNTYSTKHGLIWEFLEGNTHRNKNKSRSGTWVA
jgi:hypothetical protein